MSRRTTDHGTIRTWAEGQGGVPAAVATSRSEDDVGLIRLMFPDAERSEHANLVEISWEEVFDEFEAKRLALAYDERSLFSKIVSREADR